MREDCSVLLRCPWWEALQGKRPFMGEALAPAVHLGVPTWL